MSAAAALNYLATADTGEITHICVVLAFVVFPFVQGVWESVASLVERVR